MNQEHLDSVRAKVVWDEETLTSSYDVGEGKIVWNPYASTFVEKNKEYFVFEIDIPFSLLLTDAFDKIFTYSTVLLKFGVFSEDHIISDLKPAHFAVNGIFRDKNRDNKIVLSLQLVDGYPKAQGMTFNLILEKNNDAAELEVLCA